LKWFGDIPSFWDISRLKFEASINMGQSPSSDDCNTDGFGLPFLQGNAEFSKRHPIPKQYCNVARKIANSGDLLFSVRAPVGAINIADQSYGIGRGLCAISVRHNIDDRYLKWLVPVCRTELDSIATGSTFEAVSAEQVENVAIAMPSLDEQINIANFLDHETAKIDTLIDKQQQLIKLLKEKRQAVISHAVTKGLNPAAPMKDSGVEWLGEVPEGWGVAKMRYLVDESAAGPYGASLTKAMYTTSGYRVYGQQQVIAGSFELGDYYISKEKYAEMERYTVYPDDVLISVMGTVGKVAVVPANVEPGIINPRLVRYVFNKKRVLPEFVKIQISSSFHQDYLLKAAQGSTMDGLNMGILGGMSLAFPKIQEQQLILDHVNKVSDKFYRLISFSEKSLELLQERRTALISAAVTGKIDVRNWQPVG